MNNAEKFNLVIVDLVNELIKILEIPAKEAWNLAVYATQMRGVIDLLQLAIVISGIIFTMILGYCYYTKVRTRLPSDDSCESRNLVGFTNTIMIFGGLFIVIINSLMSSITAAALVRMIAPESFLVMQIIENLLR